MTLLTAQRLREVLDYDPATGIFHWKRRSGNVAGFHSGYGYQQIGVDGTTYLAHRLAWLWMTGSWPTADIDHADRNGMNNRFSNLRVASKSQNKINGRKYSNNTSGHRGVTWRAERQKWRAIILCHGKRVYLGLFGNIDEAAAAYTKAAETHYGEFARRA